MNSLALQLWAASPMPELDRTEPMKQQESKHHVKDSNQINMQKIPKKKAQGP